MASSQWNHATLRLESLGIARSSAVAIIRQVQTWQTNCGPEWTVKRLKDLKTAYIRTLLGENDRPTWISWRNGAPSGAFRPLWDCRTQKKVVRTLNVLMIYSSYVAPKATVTQVQKFMGSVVDPIPSVFVLSDMDVASVKMPRTLRKEWSVSLDSYPRSSSRRMPVFGRSAVQNDDSVLSDVIREVRALGYVDLYPKVFSQMRDLILTQPWHTRAGERPSVGKISFIQEPGYKLRAVANPNLVVQTALRPLQEIIWALLREIPEDCTFNQEAGVLQVEGWLKLGLIVHSVDLSDATNVFPLEIQMRLLEQALPNWGESLSCFHRASTGRWAYRDPNTGLRTQVRWKKGQPLGLAPSFGAFAFSHHFVARLAQARTGSGDYRILGDDIVIVGEEMVREYRSLLDQLGCPVSESKTLSGTVGEFAGKIVTKEGRITTAKWRDVSDENFVEVARLLGSKSLPMFRPRQRKVLREIGELPEFLGGAGWNASGKPLEDRISEFLPLIDLLDGETEHTATRMSWTSEYMWSRQVKPEITYKPSRPEKARAISVPSHLTVIGVLRPLTESVLEGENLPGYGPSEASPPHTTLNLTRWERILSILDQQRQAQGHAQERDR